MPAGACTRAPRNGFTRPTGGVSGIETRYRQLREARIRTTTRSPALRLLFVGIALLLRNVQVWVHWHYLATPRRGGRKLHLDRLPFKTLLMWLARLAEQTFGVNEQIVIESPG
jgi:putative transposase